MKRKLTAILLSFTNLLSVALVALGAPGGYAAGIDEDRIIGTEEIAQGDVVIGSSLEEAAGSLPKKVNVMLSKTAVQNAQVLHKAKFEASDWTLYGGEVVDLDGEKLSVKATSEKIKALTGGEYDDFVIETVLRGTSANIDNNFGVMFRAGNVTDANTDSYKGYYVGIGKNGGQSALVIGYGNNSWNFIDQVNFDYQPNTDYALKIMMVGKTLAVWLDGELMYQNDLSLFSSGRVGIRTYRQLFDCSAFTVRTPGAEELAEAGVTLYDTVSAELNPWTSDEYNPNKEGSYTFTTTVKGTNYKVKSKVNVMNHFEIIENCENVSYKDVEITDGFFRNYIKQMICKVVPTAIANVEKGTGGMPNIINAAKLHRGESHGAFQGAFYVDSDVHKVLESMCYALAIDPMGDEEIIKAQASISAKLEEWIPYFVDAQEESGYFDTYYTLNTGEAKFSDVNKHELYCMGHFMEAAIAHYECSGGTDTRLLDVAVKCADYLAGVFGNGEGQRKQIAGHQEIELALLKLARCMTELDASYAVKAHKYANLATFFLEVRGDFNNRTVPSGYNEYWQDHAKVEEQMSAVGHAVRAQYMYTAMAELASIDTEYRDKYDKALTALWKDVTYTKQYVTGGVGQTAANEGFLASYELPNATSYCETCAGIANMMWNRSMSKIYTSSSYADMVETDLYNAVLGCVNLDGDRFYYVNALRSYGGELRNEWYGTACCPPNLTRTILSLGGYIYNKTADSIYINQYITNTASINVGGKDVHIQMNSAMPWDGNVSIKLSTSEDSEVNLYLRMPYWSDSAKVKIDGEEVSVKADANGYILISGKDGDQIDVAFSMPILLEETDEKVKENVGYVSLRRGPIVYCAEAADNSFNVNFARIDQDSETKLVWTDSLDGKADPYALRSMYLIKLNGYTDGISEAKPVEWTFIPFFARLNREKGAMTVYVSTEHIDRPLAQYAIPSASYTYGGDSPNNLNDGSDSVNKRWTSWKDGEVLRDPWVQYDFPEEVPLKGCKIWWYDDNGGVRLPDSFEIYYKNDSVTTFTKVPHADKYTCDHSDGFITYEFDDIKVTSLKIVIKNSKAAPGIVEWEVIRSDDPDMNEGDQEEGKGENPPVGTTPSDPAVSTPADQPQNTPVVDDADGEKEEKSSLGIILGAVAAVAAAGVVAAILIAKKKKKAKSE